MSGGQEKPSGGGVGVGNGGGRSGEREMREREKREREEEESWHRFKISTGRANRTGVTAGHASQGRASTNDVIPS
jgi:hypothetical protein